MSRAWQMERAAEREQNALDRDYAEGRITAEEHRRGIREIERELRAAYEEDQYDALQQVRDEWGW